MLRKRYLGVDRQHYVVTWSQRHDRCTVQFNAIVSADLATGYAFGFHMNFDGSLNGATVEVEAETIGNLEREPPFRQYAWG